MLAPFVVVRDQTGTPGGWADTTFPLPEVLAMLRQARELVAASRRGDPNAQQYVAGLRQLAAQQGHPEQARAFLVLHLLREAAVEVQAHEMAMAANAVAAQSAELQGLQGRARTTSFAEVAPDVAEERAFKEHVERERLRIRGQHKGAKGGAKAGGERMVLQAEPMHVGGSAGEAAAPAAPAAPTPSATNGGT